MDKIVSLERDIARATRAERINILAPIPGKDTVGIEIANSKKQKVTLRELLENEDFHNAKAKIPIALGKDVYGKTIIADLAAMPHGLVAGTTGSGKSVCINAIIASILYRFTPEDLRFIMIDPKVVEMQIYNTLPHLVVPVVTDPKKVLLALRWAIDEMEKRYAIFAKTGVRNINSFNDRPLPKSQAELDAIAAAKAAAMPELPLDAPEPIDPESLSSEERIEKMTTIKVQRDAELIIPDRMPYIVIIVDELADLMQTAPADVESAIARITQKARAAGIHMIIATQTPRADVITGVIKANVPCRIAFQVASPLSIRASSSMKTARNACSARATCSTAPRALRASSVHRACWSPTRKSARWSNTLRSRANRRLNLRFTSACKAPAMETKRKKSAMRTRNSWRSASKSCARKRKPRPPFSSVACASVIPGPRAFLTSSNCAVTWVPAKGPSHARSLSISTRSSSPQPTVRDLPAHHRAASAVHRVYGNKDRSIVVTCRYRGGRQGRPAKLCLCLEKTHNRAKHSSPREIEPRVIWSNP